MSLRPTNPKKLNLDDLKPGDILLSAGDSDIDKIILMLDQGDYSHTTQYIGVENGKHMVVEATTGGIKYHSTDEDMKVQTLVDVYRYKSLDGHQLGDAGWPAAPVTSHAQTFAGGAYAYTDLLLVAVVLLASEMPHDKYLKEVTRLLLANVQHQIVKWLVDNSGKTPMTCVQVATSAFWEAAATPEHKYALQIDINGARHNPFTSKEAEAYCEIRKTILGSIPHVQNATGFKAFAGSDILPLGSCTPRDLQTSPTLDFIGCLKDSRK